MTMGRFELWAVRVVLVVVLVFIIGAMVGGVIYGPRLRAALADAEENRQGQVVAEASTEYEAATGKAQAGVQVRESNATRTIKESTHETLKAPGAADLVDPGLYSAFADGVRRNREATAQPAPGDDPAA